MSLTKEMDDEYQSLLPHLKYVDDSVKPASVNDALLEKLDKKNKPKKEKKKEEELTYEEIAAQLKF